MPYTYRLREDTIHDEEGKEYIVYGIEAVNSKKKVPSSFSDIFFDKQKAKTFVNLCNEGKLELIHLTDVVDDAITEQYAIFK